MTVSTVTAVTIKIICRLPRSNKKVEHLDINLETLTIINSIFQDETLDSSRDGNVGHYTGFYGVIMEMYSGTYFPDFAADNGSTGYLNAMWTECAWL